MCSNNISEEKNTGQNNDAINKGFEESKVEGHFRHNEHLHGNEHYQVKNYMQSVANCQALADKLTPKLEAITKGEECVIIGYKYYTELLLNVTQEKVENIVGYGIVESKGDSFAWYKELQENVSPNVKAIIILPVSCTCITYIRIKKWLESSPKKSKANKEIKGNKVYKAEREFINILHILDEKVINTIGDKQYSIQKEDIYAPFNWTTIEISENEAIITIGGNSDSDNSDFTGHSLIWLSSKLYAAEKCPLCFPARENKALKDEEIVTNFNDTYETAYLQDKLPPLAVIEEKRDNNFSHYFLKPNEESPLYYGHYKIEGSSYLTYISGKIFYKQNKDEILDRFTQKLNGIISSQKKKIEKVVFITSNSKYRSSFLEDFVLRYNKTNATSILFHILKYGLQQEFINNFIQGNENIIWGNDKDNTLKIFYEDVASGARTYKQLSNYVKHYHKKKEEEEGKENGGKEPDIRHGFDYIFTLIDRTRYHTHHEILKKLASDINIKPKDHFISFFRLNAPVVSTFHLPEPLKLKESGIKTMIKESHLDVLKQQLSLRLREKTGKLLPSDNHNNNELAYFPFEEDEGSISKDTYDLYKHIKSKNIDLLKLYAAHKVNEFFSEEKAKDEKFTTQDIIDYVQGKITEDKETFFIEEKKWDEIAKIKNRKEDKEKKLLEDEVIKTLTKAPFIYSKTVSKITFEYCLKKLDDILNDIVEIQNNKEDNNMLSFQHLRSLKFYMRRLVSLDSSFLVSIKMLNVLKILFENNDDNQNQLSQLYGKFESDFDKMYKKLERLSKDIGRLNKDKEEDKVELSKLKQKKNELSQQLKSIKEKEKEKRKDRNNQYKTQQIKGFHSFVVGCYKESIYKNHYRSIELERLLNSDGLPKLFDDVKINDATKIEEKNFKSFIKDPYYILTGMIKSENIYLLNNVKHLYKEKPLKDNKNKEALREYYFKGDRNDPIITEMRKLVDNSIFKLNNPQDEKHNHIKSAVANMLECTGIIKDKEKETNGKGIEDNIIKILQAVGKIIESGINTEYLALDYALCVEYKNTEIKENETDDIICFQANGSGGKIRSDVKFRKQGLIYNLIKGLSVFEKTGIGKRREQSLLAAVRIKKENNERQDNGKYLYYSYDDFYSTGKDPKRSFDTLYKNDMNAVSILKDADMALFFRLSELEEYRLEHPYITEEKEGNNILTGKVALIITCKKKDGNEVTFGDYKDFMSNEKVRLISLIKNDILAYLNKKIIGNDIFSDWLKSRKADTHIRTMEHNVMPLFYSTKKHIEELAVRNPETDNNIIGLLRFNIMEHYLKSLIPDSNRKNYSIRSEDLELISITKDSIKMLFKLILEASGIECNTIDELDREGNEKYKLYIDIEGNDFQYPKGMYYYILPELFYNIRKNTCKMYPVIPQYNIKYEPQHKRLIITNTYFEEHTNNNSTKRGKEICEQQCSKLQYQIKYNSFDTNDFVQIGLSNKSVQIKKYQVIILPKNDIISN